ncbi:hypothetical protein FRACYDRAFT_207358 [Fragilariopsis cylindrus CCMP1102]|uniref:Ubiquitin-like domain-containing protein n=1 Tax=Fragilariopsis cylindrus CCMP1102 TaxID=635003 RepID=A0A1E7FLK6_9STRA|nr:hypothetical protein FRACYDRAFT_207358 [Fragilariopsis cylindrus CCMP1102]|eukprot:OEU19049.1 hypothetical protein FRACYDRAFT_207358 [Fragilariopsis cylindrus CCMP1102]
MFIRTMMMTTTVTMTLFLTLFGRDYSCLAITSPPLFLPLKSTLTLNRSSVVSSSTISFLKQLRGGDGNGNGDGEIDNDGGNGTGTDEGTTTTKTTTTETVGNKILLRIRLPDGSIERIEIEETYIDSFTLNDLLKPFNVPDNASIRIGTGTNTNDIESDGDGDKTLQTLDVKHGSMITIIPSPKVVKENEDNNNDTRVSRLAAATAKKKAATAAASSSSSSKENWNPYPELAKNYDELLLQTKTKRSSRTSLSYSDISKLQSALHIVEPQKDGPILRVYMCRISAERFYSNGITTTTSKSKITSTTKSSRKKKQQQQSQQQTTTNYNCRVGLLLGTIQKERVDKPETALGLTKKKVARTSLSSQTSDSDYCTVGKVHAVWEPPSQQQPASSSSSSSDNNQQQLLYDTTIAKQLMQQERVLLLSKFLGLLPIGWIFSYNDERLKSKRDQSLDKKLGNNDPQALFGNDIMTNEEDGDKFVTLSMDATTGATEAFQLSDVSVQMIYEDMFENVLSSNLRSGDMNSGVVVVDANNNNNNPPIVPMRHEILIDGKETKQLDSVLCLVNTAMLSHVGHYSGGGSSSSSSWNSIKKSNGSLTKKTKKSLLKALEASSSGDGEFLELLSDFNVLVGLDQLLSSHSSNNDDDSDIKMICGLVRKWSRGQKQTTKIDSKLKRKLMTYLGS